VVWCRGVSFVGLVVVACEELLAVAAAEQEDEAVQVVAQLRDAVGGVADALGEQGLQPRFGGKPFAEEGQNLGELAGVADVEFQLGHESSRRKIAPLSPADASQTGWHKREMGGNAAVAGLREPGLTWGGGP
jgi:hypothetical protein